MPSIAEKLAAAKAAKAGAAKPTAFSATAGKKPASPGLKLRAEPEEQPTPPAEDATPRRRSLSTTSGEEMPLTPADAPRDVLAWHSALQGYESELCLMHDPDPRQERGWLAVRRADRPDEPILLFPLPLFPHPKPIRPDEDEPY